MSHKEIPLSQGKYTLVDERDYDFLSQWKWYYGNGYAYRTTYPSGMKGQGVKILMHRAIMQCPEKYFIDHRDGNTLDNRKENLRIATPSQNQWNRGVPRNNKSGHKGIVWDPINNKWRAGVNDKGKYHNLGRYKTISEAVAVREKYITERHGEFARQV